MILTMNDLLSPAQISQISTLLRQSRFIDGSATANLGRDSKYNEELEVDSSYVSIVEIIAAALRDNLEVERRIFPRFITRPIISRYREGMFYDEHIDRPIQGMQNQSGRSLAPYGTGFVRTDFSMTLFLSDPKSYDGGDLQIWTDGEARRFKLKAGSAVFYETGSRHSVLPVTKGARVAAVVWLQSMVKNEQSRKLLGQTYELCKEIHAITGESRAFAQASDLFSNMVRHFADV